jgi:hypothetical protein
VLSIHTIHNHCCPCTPDLREQRNSRILLIPLAFCACSHAAAAAPCPCCARPLDAIAPCLLCAAVGRRSHPWPPSCAAALPCYARAATRFPCVSVRYGQEWDGGRDFWEDEVVRQNIGDGVIRYLKRICCDAAAWRSTKQEKKMDDAGPSDFIPLDPSKETHPNTMSWVFLFREGHLGGTRTRRTLLGCLWIMNILLVEVKQMRFLFIIRWLQSLLSALVPMAHASYGMWIVLRFLWVHLTSSNPSPLQAISKTAASIWPGWCWWWSWFLFHQCCLLEEW